MAPMSITLAEAQAQVAAWREASLALAKGASYTLDGRSLTRANAAEVKQMLDYWTRLETQLRRAARPNPPRLSVDPARATFGPR